jgi:hypothetical protein
MEFIFCLPQECCPNSISELEGIMADNNKAITKEDLKSALDEVVAHLTKFIKDTTKGTAAETEAKLMAEMDRRFTESRDAMNKRFQSADRQRQKFRQEVGNQFHEIRATIDNRFDMAKEYTDEAVVKKIRAVITMLDGQVGVTSRLDTEQMTLGALDDKLRADLDTTKNSHDSEITDLKRGVIVIEEKLFAESAK